MIKLAVPLLHVSDSARAEDFYCNRLGFRRRFGYRADETKADPCFLGLSRDGAWLHVSSFPGDGVPGGVAGFFVEDVDALHGELVAKGVPIALEPTDQTWGNREMYVKDPEGNCLRFMRAGPRQTNRVECVVPILNVASVPRSVRHYTEVLGFSIEWGAGDGSKMASVSRDGHAVMLCEGAQGHPGTWVWIGVEDVEALFERYRASGAKVRREPANHPWAYEMQIEDPDGHVLRFGSEPKTDRPFEPFE